MFSNKILKLLMLLLPAAAYGQNLDPTVEVTRTFKATLMEVHKPMLGMQVPDSVTHFDLDFDYSVFESPYNGTYEFKPYVLDMKPQPNAWSGRRLFLKAGAGYPLHPLFDFVWSPDLQGKFRMSIYAMHRSYVGGYRNIGYMVESDSPTGILDFRNKSAIDGGDRIAWKGYDLLTRAGINGRTDWKKGVFSFDIGYYGLATKDSLLRRGYDALDANVRVRSLSDRERYFMYDIAFDYRYGEDKLDYKLPVIGKQYLVEHNIGFGASLGPVLSRSHKVLIDIDANVAAYDALYVHSAGRFAVTPRYVLEKGRWNLSAGVCFSLLFNGGDTSSISQEQKFTKGQYIYPDVKVGFDLVKDHMDIYAQAGGGDRTGKYSDLISVSHFIHPMYSGVLPLLDNTVERISAAIGLKGNIASRFDYDLRAGYRNYANAPMFAIVSASPDMSGDYAAALGYTGYNMLYLSLDCAWRSDDVSANANFRYSSTDVNGRQVGAAGYNPSWEVSPVMAFMAPSAFSGKVDVTYNWHKRIYAGIDCDFSLERKSSLCSLPGYADLGVYLEFKAARLFSIWLRGGNLLDMTVQRTPLYAESGINFTAGICLNL